MYKNFEAAQQTTYLYDLFVVGSLWNYISGKWLAEWKRTQPFLRKGPNNQLYMDSFQPLDVPSQVEAATTHARCPKYQPPIKIIQQTPSVTHGQPIITKLLMNTLS